MKSEPLKFFRVKIEVFPAIARPLDTDGWDHDTRHADVRPEPIIRHTEDVTVLAGDGYLQQLIKNKMLEIGKQQMFAQCPDPRLLEEK